MFPACLSARRMSTPAPHDAFPTPGNDLDAVALQLAQLRLGPDGSAWHAFADGADRVIRALGLGRLGVWLFSEDRMAIRSYLVVQPSGGERFAGTILRRRDFPTYFAALDEHPVICVDDARESPLTSELGASYLEPIGIGAMLDAPIYREGRTVGVVCHEHIGGTRRWSEGERHVAALVAQAFARLVEESERQDAESRIGAAHGQLERLERMAALARLAAGVAHDFRNVLHGINIVSETIRDECGGNASVAGFATDIQRSVQRGEALVQSLLAFGQETPSAPVVLDVGGALRSMERLLTLSVGSRITLTLRVAERIGRVFIDPRELERVLVNLVLNARDAMPTGGTLDVSVRDTINGEVARYAPPDTPGVHDASWLVIELKDSGIGIAPDVVPRLFEPFFTTKGERGTGLGLPIVEQLIRSAGGHVAVESALGAGATFRLFLPCTAPPA